MLSWWAASSPFPSVLPAVYIDKLQRLQSLSSDNSSKKVYQTNWFAILLLRYGTRSWLCQFRAEGTCNMARPLLARSSDNSPARCSGAQRIDRSKRKSLRFDGHFEKCLRNTETSSAFWVQWFRAILVRDALVRSWSSKIGSSRKRFRWEWVRKLFLCNAKNAFIRRQELGHRSIPRQSQFPSLTEWKSFINCPHF